MDKNYEILDRANKSKLYRQASVRISSQHTLIYCRKEFYEYTNGAYSIINEYIVKRWIDDILQEDNKSHSCNEVLAHLKRICFKDGRELNAYNLINVKNGMLDLNNLDFNNLQAIPHDSKYLSTIQLNVECNEDNLCDNWLNFLKEIFNDDDSGYKIRVLQEWFGLCLTKETKFEKCLWMVGEGANGKSVITHILHALVGDENSSAIPIEFLKEGHYQADLFGKLVNVSSEANNKNKVCDELMKKVISGDVIQAAGKYMKSSKFKPFCKMIICANSHPRVDDRSDGYWRRLLVLKFTRQFSEQEQKKTLKYDLLNELNGIFIWALYGLRNLQKRRYFEINAEMQTVINKLRNDNNNVRIFIDDCCTVDGVNSISVKELYRKYSDWANDSNIRPFGKQNFNEELIKLSKGKVQKYKSGIHYWKGLKYEE